MTSSNLTPVRAYQEYMANHRYIEFNCWDEAEFFTAYLQRIGHELVGTLKTSPAIDPLTNKAVVSVCEPMA